MFRAMAIPTCFQSVSWDGGGRRGMVARCVVLYQAGKRVCNVASAERRTNLC